MFVLPCQIIQNYMYVRIKNSIYKLIHTRLKNSNVKTIFSSHPLLNGLIVFADKKPRQNYYLKINVSVLVIHTHLVRPFEMTSSVLDCFEMCVKQKKLH